MHESQESGVFPGGVFSKAIEGGRAGAEISLTTDAVIATLHDGQAFAVPYAECLLELGGSSGKMWFCRTADRATTIFCEAPGFDAALHAAGNGELAGTVRRIMVREQAQSRASFKRWGIGLVVFAVLCVGLYFGLKHASRASIGMLPPSVDAKIGQLAMASMTLDGDIVDDDVVVDSVAAIMRRLVPQGEADGFRFKVRVVDAPIVNAFALPGGQIVVYTGLLRAADNPEQVAGVLAHEMAHVTRRHGMQRIAQGVGVFAGVQLLLGDVSGVAAVAVEVLQQGAINSYSRDDEHEADMDGVARLRSAGIDPVAMADLFEVFRRRDGDLPSVIAWLGTHPELQQRIKDIKLEAKRLGAVKVKPLDVRWAEVQRRVGKATEAPAPTDKPAK